MDCENTLEPYLTWTRGARKCLFRGRDFFFLSFVFLEEEISKLRAKGYQLNREGKGCLLQAEEIAIGKGA